MYLFAFFNSDQNLKYSTYYIPNCYLFFHMIIKCVYGFTEKKLNSLLL